MTVRNQVKGIKLYENGVYLVGGRDIIECGTDERTRAQALTLLESRTGLKTSPSEASEGTIAYPILQSHNSSGNSEHLEIKFDALASHDITYVGIIQTARASGLGSFPVPYVLTNCHNSLCAVGGTINEDDHMFGLTGAQKYGGIYVPAHLAVIHQYVREMMAGCGKMILGSDSHTRYGALGTLAIGEGGGELAKQLLGKPYELRQPNVVAVYLSGKPQEGVGPQDVALAIIGTVFRNGFVKNKVMEFVGDGISNLSAEYRMGIDVMTTETACLSSIWETDNIIEQYFETHGRKNDFAVLKPAGVAYYDSMIYVDLSAIRPMIALPFHPANTYEIEELNRNAGDILAETEKEGQSLFEGGKVKFSLQDKLKGGILEVQQAVIAGCAGGMYENICAASDILGGHTLGSGQLSLSIYPASQPLFLQLLRNGAIEKLAAAGATIRTAFCGPCFGAGDTPSNNDLSIRHTTRNFPNREGSKPGEGQIASVALMDARSIAATVRNGGRLTPATDLQNVGFGSPVYFFDKSVYDSRVYSGYRKALPETDLKRGPGIADWPAMSPLTDDLILRVVSVINDPVTTTDEIIPSGETSSYRSNPLKLAEYTLSRKDPAYVSRAKEVQLCEIARIDGRDPSAENLSLAEAVQQISACFKIDPAGTGIGSTIFAVKPGDGSAREQAASSQKVLGGWANIAKEYATKRYRSNLINWGLLPFIYNDVTSNGNGTADTAANTTVNNAANTAASKHISVTGGGSGNSESCPALPFKSGDFLFIPGIRRAVAEKAENIKVYVASPGQPELNEFFVTLGDLTDDERSILLAGSLINFYKPA